MQQAASEVDRLFPLSLAAEGSCQIGGNLSTNAGGIHVVRYGNSRDLVLGLEVVTADGTLWDGLRALRKDNTGYDLKHLFLGAEGTLGVITAAVLKLFPRHRHVETVFAAVPDVPRAVALLARVRGATDDAVLAFELIPRIALEFVTRHVPGTTDPLAAPAPWYVLFDLTTSRALAEETVAAAMTAGLILDATLAGTPAQASALWRLREAISEVTEARRRQPEARRLGAGVAHPRPGRTGERRHRPGGPRASARSPSGTWATATFTSTSASRWAPTPPASWRARKRSTGWCTTWWRRWAARSAPNTASAWPSARRSAVTRARWRSR